MFMYPESEDLQIKEKEEKKREKIFFSASRLILSSFKNYFSIAPSKTVKAKL